MSENLNNNKYNSNNKKYNSNNNKYNSNNNNDTNNVIELTKEQEDNLLSRFPLNAELSLCKRLSSKIQADIYQIIPMGKHAQLWYTYFNDMNVAVIVTKTHGVFKVETTFACFTDEIAYGTILSGVYIKKACKNNVFKRVFCADNLSHYKGEYVGDLSMLNKLSIITNMFEYNEIGNIKALNNSIRVCMPIMSNNITIINNTINNLPYPTYGIKFINYNDTTQLGEFNTKIEDLTSPDKKYVFLVKANIEPDSYTLYGKDAINYNSKQLHRIGIALIPTYQDSIRMNTLFRRIRENMNIDFIEDSEDEDDFENIEPEKFLLPNVEYKMYCSLSANNRWIPESIAPPDSELSSVSKYQFKTLQNMKSLNNINEIMNHKKHKRARNFNNSDKEFSYITENKNQHLKKNYTQKYNRPKPNTNTQPYNNNYNNYNNNNMKQNNYRKQFANHY